MVIQEPTLGIPCREAGVDIDGRIVGALVLDSDGKVVKRFSWFKLVFVEKRGFEITPTGLLFEQDPTGTKFLVGRLRAFFLPDKNRMDGYVGIFGTKPIPKISSRSRYWKWKICFSPRSDNSTPAKLTFRAASYSAGGIFYPKLPSGSNFDKNSIYAIIYSYLIIN